ncbi:MAG TPA: type II toxin-antitoxin system VapC family toxin [Candidatus Baltobacteraceae bacterium]|nr:type II toxin-antitoxin system VapC family toxin [Candidatus Baltobacteraceae bacterium]
MVLLDSDILIDYLRGLSAARNYFKSVDAAAISVVSVTELVSGARNDEEEAAMNELFSTMHIVGVDEKIAREAGRLRRQFLRSHNVETADALIAATSILHRLQMVTLNRRHYPMLADVLVPYRKRE